MAYGGSVGSAAAEGIASGFQIGQQADAAADRRAEIARNNARQDAQDQVQANEILRNHQRQDLQDSLTATNAEMEDNSYQLAALAQKYGGQANIPQSVVQPFIDKAKAIAAQRTALMGQMFKPVVQAEQQKWQDLSDRIAAGQATPDLLSPADTVRWMQTQSGIPARDFLRPDVSDPAAASDVGNGVAPGNSVVGQAIANVKAGVPANNGPLIAQGANVLLAPSINVGNGQAAPDGGIVVNKTLTGFAPAPANPATAPPAPSVLTGLNAALGAAIAPVATSSPVNPVGPGAPPPAAEPAPDPGVGDPGANNPAVAAANAPPPATGIGNAGAVASTAAPPPPSSGLPPMPAGGDPGVGDPGANDPAVAAANTPAPAAAAPAPAPAPWTPGTDPDKVIPILQVTAEHPDGTQVTYHAPVTLNRSTDPSDPIHPGISISDMMQRMGQLGTLEAWANTPAARAKIEQGIKDLGDNIDDFTSAYAAMRGDPKALLPAGSTDPTTLKIQAYTKAAAAAGMPLGDYVRMIEGKTDSTTGINAQITQIHAQAVKDGLSDEAEAKKLQGLGVLRTPPSEKGQKAPAGYEPDPANPGALRFIKGGPADPDVKGGAAVLGAREAVFINRTLTSANEAAQDLANVVRLPITASTGIFGGRHQGPGLLDAGKEALANTLTSQDVQSYNVRSAGFHRALAGIESAGLAPSGQLSNQMDSVILKAGDSYMTKLEKLAQTRQIVEAGLETTLANPKLPKQQAELAQTVINRVRTAVPFTMADVDTLQNLQETKPNATMADVMKQNGLNKPGGGTLPGGGSAPTVANDADYNALPSGTTFLAPDGKLRKKP